ncbi:MAG: S-layer homology domain-containing protein [Armatimonadetes bacterium]|nr:S-layer homology domain-containing protein [Armatimonadota bacterium]
MRWILFFVFWLFTCFPAFAGEFSLSEELPFRPGQVIVQFRETSVPDLIKMRALGISSALPKKASGEPLLLDLAPGKNVLEVIRQLANDPDVIYAEPNYLYRAMALPASKAEQGQALESVNAGVYGDPYFSSQWYLAAMNIPAAWSQLPAPASSPVRVAVVDSGIDGNHPDLPPLLAGYDFIADRPVVGGDPNGHGTLIAGLIAAVAGNGVGIAGVAGDVYAPGVQLLPVRVLDEEGSGDAFTIARGIRWAAGLEEINGAPNPAPADIINLSLGGPAYSATLARAIRDVQERGVLVVAAAGNAEINRPPDNAAGIYPAALPGVLTVGAAVYGPLITGPGAEEWRGSQQWELAPFSNYGNVVEVAAPGVNILSTFPAALQFSGPEEGYAWKSGTSFASALVAGLAALIQAAAPEWRGSTLVDLFSRTGPILEVSGNRYRLADGKNLLTAAATQGSPAVAILDPKPDQVMSGRAVIAVSLGKPAERVSLELLDADGNPVAAIGSATGRPGSLVLIPWELSKSLVTGRYQLMARAYQGTAVVGEASVPVKICGEGIVSVIPPAQEASAIEIFVLTGGPSPGRLIWKGETDAMGNVVLPAEIAGAEGERYVVACGWQERPVPGGKGNQIPAGRVPYFLYWRKLSFPLSGNLVLDGTDAVPLVLDGSVPGEEWLMHEGFGCLLDEAGRPVKNFYLGKADSLDGQEPDDLVIFLTPGTYAVRVQGACLNGREEKINRYLTERITPVPQGQDEAVRFQVNPETMVPLAWEWKNFPDARLYDLECDLILETAEIFFSQEDQPAAVIPYPLRGEDEPRSEELFVTPGVYRARLVIGEKEPVTGRQWWSYTFEVPELSVSGAQPVDRGLSPELQGKVTLAKNIFQPGEEISFGLEVTDGCGQRLVEAWDLLQGELRPRMELQNSAGEPVLPEEGQVDYTGGRFRLPAGIPAGDYRLAVSGFALHPPWAGKETAGSAGLTVFSGEGQTPPSGGGGGGSGGGGTPPPSGGGGGGAPPQTSPGSPPEPVEPRVKWSTTVVDSFRESMVSAGDGLLTAVFPRGALPAGTHLSAAAVEQAEPLRELAFSFGRGFLAAFQLKARDAQGSTLSAVGQPFTLNFTLARADVFRQSPAGGLVRSSAAGLLKESPVGCYYYDPVYGALVPVPTVIRPAAGEITARGGRLGTYVLVEEKPKTFTDLKGDEWYAAAVARLAQKNLFGGFPDGGFHPEENLTRAQAAKLVCLGGRVPGVRQADPFSDTQGHWAALSIGSAAAAGLISGYPDGTFRPDAPVTRAELVVLFLRLLGERAEEGQPLFSDVKPTHWAYGAITRAAAAGFVSGYPDGTFRPDAPVTRAEAAGMAARAFNEKLTESNPDS